MRPTWAEAQKFPFSLPLAFSRTAKAHAANHSFDALDGVLKILDKQINEVDLFWPPDAIHSADHFKHLIRKAVHQKDTYKTSLKADKEVGG